MPFPRDTNAFVALLMEDMPQTMYLDEQGAARVGETIDRKFESMANVANVHNGDLGILTIDMAEVAVGLLQWLRGDSEKQRVEWCFDAISNCLHAAGLMLKDDPPYPDYLKQRFHMVMRPLLPVRVDNQVVQPRVAEFYRTFYEWPAAPPAPASHSRAAVEKYRIPKLTQQDTIE